MLHFSCDACGKTLTPATAPRYVVKMEAYPAATDLADADTDADAVEEMALLLEEAEEAGEELPAPGSQKFRFDMCGPCHRKFVANPFGRVRAANVRFSGN